VESGKNILLCRLPCSSGRWYWGETAFFDKMQGASLTMKIDSWTNIRIDDLFHWYDNKKGVAVKIADMEL